MTIGRVLFVLFIVVPLVEIYLFIKIGAIIGAFTTVALIVLTALIGAGLLRVQGLTTLSRAQANLARGDIPAMEILEGAVLVMAGALLLTPGFFTDAIGFLALVPPLRRHILLWVIERHILQVFARRGDGAQHPQDRGEHQAHRPRQRTINGDYRKDK